MPKVLVTDSLAPQGFEILESAPGIEVVDAPGLAPGQLLEAIADADALIIRSATQVTREVIAAAKQLAVVGRAGIGVDNVDVDAATARGIVVMNTPGGNTVTTAEHSSAARRLARHIPRPRFEKLAIGTRRRSSARSSNLTLGVIGLGTRRSSRSARAASA